MKQADSYIPLSTHASLTKQLIAWRRHFHQFPEPGWCEYHTAATVASTLEALGYNILFGKELIGSDTPMGLPAKATSDDFFTQACKHSVAHKKWLTQMEGGHTAVAGILENGQGPTLLFRFDMDALPLQEQITHSHLPAKEGFQSRHPNYMHACGHDAHTAIGLGLASVLMKCKSQIRGKIILLFQPAEEGLRGAAALVSNPLFARIDYGFGFHLWSYKPVGQLICGTNGQLASSKFDIHLRGKAAHAGLAPEAGINAMLPAAEIILALEDLRKKNARHARLNVGLIEGGAGRNIICPSVKLAIETRSISSEQNTRLYNQALAIIKDKVHMHNCRFTIQAMGYADAADSNKNLAKQVKQVADSLSFFNDIRLIEKAAGNSEDFTIFMNHIQKTGGQALYMGVGASNKTGAHHTPDFDIDESTFIQVVDLLTGICLQPESGYKG